MEDKPKKIIVVGVVEHGMTLKIAQMAVRHNATVEYREQEEGKEPYAIAEGFDPNPPKTTIPYVMAPYLSMLDDLPRIYDGFSLNISDGKPHSKYARSATQEELDAPKVGRNELCHCGSGKKFKKCHGK